MKRLGEILQIIFCILALNLALLSAIKLAEAAEFYLLPSGQQAVIDEHGICRVVTNTTAKTIYIPTKSAAEWSSFYTTASGSVTAPACAGCTLDGANVAHGASRTFYLSTRSCYGTCGAISQTRNCYNGVFDGSASYSKASCPSPTCASCTTASVNWTTGTFTCSASATGGSHITTRNVTDNTAPNVGSASFECDDGTWDQASGSCGGASCARPWGGTVAHGASVTAYQTSTVGCGNTCTSQSRTCNNGALGGSYTNQSCTVDACASCTTASVNWTTGSYTCSASATSGAHGTTRNISDSASPSIGSAAFQCNNGTWNQSSGSCGAASCARPWGGTVAHGASVTAYQTASVSCGNTCASQTRSCSNGTLSGGYTHQSCSVGACSSCSLDGATVAHGASRVFYLSSRSCGQACTAIDLSRSCNNGTLSGSSTYNKKSCPAQTCASCTRPWGGTIAHGASLTAYQSSSVACGSSCNSQTRNCNNGSLSGSYTKQSCSVQACNADCTAPDGSTVAHGSCVTRYTRSTVIICPTDLFTCMDYSTSWCCNNGTGSGSWGSYASCNNNYTACFVPEALITMADGSQKAVKDLKVGDLVKGETRNNTVQRVPSFDRRTKIYSFNGEEEFVTSGHPFKTLKGWKAIDPMETPLDGHNVKVTKLKVGDVLIREDGSHVKIDEITETEKEADHHVYNPVLNGDHTYYANGYLVHNKPNCP
ncbi:Hint domain-containing protein [Sphingopyxis sp. BSNA05]|uniref:Hint domain-containing protein n=1 Tax=Sphingopyxis sp. BSNA05 TaxID=1236614 RepID=UPI0015654217|nr:Hint domain-containing protein [Sphingopyxis sp. BSNA05]